MPPLRSILLSAVLLALPVVASAQAGASLNMSIDEAARLATRWFEEGRPEEASRMVKLLRATPEPHPQILFLSGQLAMADGDFRLAVSEFRRLLSEDPSLIRVRLELARALYELRDFDAARYHFELALGEDVPEAARANIQGFLQRIRSQISSYSLSAMLVPDSNVNQSTRAETVDVLGRTFTLNGDARAKSALGLALVGQSRHAFGGEHRSFVRTYLEHREYPARYADFSFLQVTLGHSLQQGPSTWTLEAGPLASIYQDKGLYRGGMAQLSHGRPLGRSLWLNQSLNWKQLDYPDYTYLSGHQTWLGHDLRYAINRTSVASLSLWLGKSRAAESAYGYQAAEWKIGYLKELGRGFTVELRLAGSRFDYSGESPLFGEVRHDREGRVEVDITRRDWSWRGFAPKLTLTHTDHRSNLPLYNYRRTYLGLGVTREF